jgi:hypothetical protein
MSPKIHKLFITRCDLQEARQVCATDCQSCPRGSVIDGRSRVICSGETKFFTTPCYFDMRASATVHDCRKCPSGTVGQDGLRVFCDRL